MFPEFNYTVEIIQAILYSLATLYERQKLITKCNRNNLKKNTWKLNNILLNKDWFKEEIKSITTCYLENRKNENNIYQN